MRKTLTREDFVRWGRMGAAITNSNYPSEKRKKAARKAWRTRRSRAKESSK